MRALLWIVWAALAGWLGWNAIYHKAPAIEQDILQRSAAAVKPANANAEVLVDGRFVTVRGPEPTQEAKAKTLQTADNVYGALGPYDGLWVPVAANAAEFVVADKSLDGSLILSGSVPSEEAKAAAEAAAKESFTGVINNQLTVSGNGGASALGGLPAALKSLSSLDIGSLLAIPDRFRLSGLSREKTIADNAAALAVAEPAKWSVYVQGPAETQAVAAAVPAPGYFNAVKAPNGSFIANGEVATNGDKTALLDALRSAANGAAVIDRVNVRAEGLPSGWADRISAGVRALTGLDWGTVSLDGAKSSLNGSAAADKVSGLIDALGGGWTAEVANTPADANATRIAELEAAAKAAAEKVAADLAAAKREAELAAAKALAAEQAALAAAQQKIATLEAQLAAKPAAPVTPGEPVDRAKVCNEQMAALMLGKTIEFDTGSARIARSGIALIDAIAEAAKPCLSQGLRVEVAGHTDDVGEDASNMTLSQQRADAVKAALETRGLPASDISAKGYGETRPLATNETDEGRAQNRRIYFDWFVR